MAPDPTFAAAGPPSPSFSATKTPVSTDPEFLVMSETSSNRGTCLLCSMEVDDMRVHLGSEVHQIRARRTWLVDGATKGRAFFCSACNVKSNRRTWFIEHIRSWPHMEAAMSETKRGGGENDVSVFPPADPHAFTAVSYTHLTLPTN